MHRLVLSREMRGRRVLVSHQKKAEAIPEVVEKPVSHNGYSGKHVAIVRRQTPEHRHKTHTP